MSLSVINSAAFPPKESSIPCNPRRRLPDSAFPTEPTLLKEVADNIDHFKDAYAKRSFDDYLNKLLKHHPHRKGAALYNHTVKKARHAYEKDLYSKIEADLHRLWTLYHNGLNGGSLNADIKPLLILGPKELRTDQDYVRNFGMICDEGDSKGCIFGGKWNLLRNDLMILSAIHANKTVMLYLPRGLKQEVLWNQDDKRPSMLCREIAILSAAGYKRLLHDYENTLGYIMTLDNSEQAAKFTLAQAAKAGLSASPLSVQELFS